MVVADQIDRNLVFSLKIDRCRKLQIYHNKNQMPPKESDLITKYIRKVDDLFAIKVADQEELIEDGVLKVIGDEVDKAYLDEVKQVTINQELVAEEGKTMKLIFTPVPTFKPVCPPQASMMPSGRSFLIISVTKKGVTGKK